MSANNATASQTKEEVKKVPAKPADGFVMPALDELIEQTEVAKDLPAEQREAAFKEAQKIDITDGIKVMDFGLDVQKKASKVTQAFINDVGEVGLERITELAAQTNQTMEALRIGELKPGIFSRFIPGAMGKKVDLFLEKYRGLSDAVTKTEISMAEERTKLQDHHARMKAKIEENRKIYDEISQKIAAGEISYAANQRRVDELKAQFQATSDGAKARDVSLLDQALARQARRINTLKASRQETLTALRMMDLQLQGIESQISMIDEQVSFNRQVWDNSVLMAATDRRMKNSVQAVQYNREQIEKMLKERGGSIGDTLAAIVAEQGQGVVNAAVLEYAAAEVAKYNQAMIKGAQVIRQKMTEANEVVARMDTLLKHTAARTESLTPEEEAAVAEILSRGGNPAPTDSGSGDSDSGNA